MPPDPWEQPPTEFVHGGSMAWQKDLFLNRVTGNENCLHLSVYTRSLEPETLRPVMVWIHGGAFILGSNAKEIYNPELLLRKDIVLVAINYRLGAFGMYIYIFFHRAACFMCRVYIFHELTGPLEYM